MEEIVAGNNMSGAKIRTGTAQTRWNALTVNHLAVALQPMHRWACAVQTAGRPGKMQQAAAELALSFLSNLDATSV